MYMCIVAGGGEKNKERQSVPLSMWVLGIQLRSSGFVAATSILQAASPAL